MKKINKISVSKVGCFPLALSLTSSARQTRSTKKSKIKMRKGKKSSLVQVDGIRQVDGSSIFILCNALYVGLQSLAIDFEQSAIL